MRIQDKTRLKLESRKKEENTKIDSRKKREKREREREREMNAGAMEVDARKGEGGETGCSDRDRLTAELEFVQLLANPQYLNCKSFFKEERGSILSLSLCSPLLSLSLSCLSSRVPAVLIEYFFASRYRSGSEQVLFRRSVPQLSGVSQVLAAT